jgi:hypothetical protein
LAPAYSQILHQIGNVLAYLLPLKGENFIAWTIDINVIKVFFFISDAQDKELFLLAELLQHSLVIHATTAGFKEASLAVFVGSKISSLVYYLFVFRSLVGSSLLTKIN